MSLAASVLATTNRVLLEPLLWRFPVPTQRRLLELGTRGLPVPRGTEVHRITLGDRPADRVSAPGVDQSRAVLHLHGGAWITMSARTHRAFAAHLSAASGLPSMLVQWVTHERLAPESAALVDAVRAAGGQVEADPLPGLFHDVQLYAGVVPEATAAVRVLGAWLAATPGG